MENEIKKIKITLDTGCINIKEDQILDKIFDLEEEGKIEINISHAFIRDVLKGEERVDQLPIGDRFSAHKRLSKAKKYQQIKSGVKFVYPYSEFPWAFGDENLFKKVKEILSSNVQEDNVDEEDIRHLVAHKIAKNDIFVTINRRHFIDGERREKLKKLGIVVTTPEEFVIEYMKICDKLKEDYKLANNKIEIEYESKQGFKSWLSYPQTIIKNGKNIGGLRVKKDENLIDLEKEIIDEEIHIDIMMNNEERSRGNGRNTLALLFCNSKVRKIKYEHIDISCPFWKSVDPNFDPNKDMHDLAKETFFRHNIDKIISTMHKDVIDIDEE